MITLRSNQVEPIRKAVEFFSKKKPRPSLIVLPTAWGKSILTAHVAAACNDKLLVLQPTKELLEQNYAKYFMLCGDMDARAGIYSASFRKREIEQITYATIGSIKNLGKEFREMGFTKMLIDEAHLYPRESDSMLGHFLEESGITHVLGITATPIKLQQNTDLEGNTFSKLAMLTSRSKKGNFFKDIIHVGQVSEMVELGFWSPLLYEVQRFDGSRLVFNSKKSEYTEESVKAAYDANGGSGILLQAIAAHPERRHILAFAPSVSDAIEMSQRCPDSGVVYGDMDKKERAKVIEDFRSGRLRVLFNVRVLSTGFDFTGIDCIVLGISTASIALYYQIVGRATRIDPDKKDALIIDLGGNYDRFGRVEDIYFEQGTVWRMYGTGGRLLSGIPIHELGSVTRDDVKAEEERRYVPIETMPFGKYKGISLKEIPQGYKKWLLENFSWKGENDPLRRSLVATM